MSFGGTTRTGVFRPFDEICSCEHEESYSTLGPFWICICTRTKEQAKLMCSQCMDGDHDLRECYQDGSLK